MKMNKLGRTGLFVSELCLGCMTFGEGEGMWSAISGLNASESERMIGRAFEAGVNFLDTADVYSDGRSEEVTGQALRSLGIRRDDVVVATKAYGRTGPGANSGGSSRVHLIDACKASLRRLGLDHIDLYQLHGFDPATPLEETLRALDVLVQHGHVRYVGVSNWAAWQIAKALGTSERLGLARPDCLQAYYTIAGRDLEREIVPLLQSETVGLMVWSPLAGGLLSGKYARDGQATDGRRATFDFPPVDRERAFSCIDAMRPMAAVRGATVAQVALAWLLHRRVVSSVIIGAKRMEQLEDNLRATDMELTDEELDVLDTVSVVPPEYPGWMFQRQAMRKQQLAEAGRPNAR